MAGKPKEDPAQSSKHRLIRLLESRKTLSGEELANDLGISRQALNKQIQILREKGFKIEGKQNVGYRLTESPDLVTPEQVGAALETRKIGKQIFHYEYVDSTQNKAKDLSSYPEGTLVVADTQSAGKGRMGRAWVSEPGGLWFSILLKPKVRPQWVPSLALAASIAVAHAIEEEHSVQCGLKWPNDILVDGKKICGILTEMSAEADRVNWVVLGIGINANNDVPEELRGQATSLKEVLGARVQRARLLQKVLQRFEEVYERFLKTGFEGLKEDYMKKSVLVGKKVTLSDFDKKIEGVFASIHTDGSLVLKLPGNKQERFFAGDVTLQ